MLIRMLNSAAEAGKRMALKWYHDPEEDMMLEFSQDLKEEFPLLQRQCSKATDARHSLLSPSSSKHIPGYGQARFEAT